MTRLSCMCGCRAARALPLDLCCGAPSTPLFPSHQLSATLGGVRGMAPFPVRKCPEDNSWNGSISRTGSGGRFFLRTPWRPRSMCHPLHPPLTFPFSPPFGTQTNQKYSTKKISSVRPEYLYTPSLPLKSFSRTRLHETLETHTRTHTQKLFAHLTLPAPLPPSERGGLPAGPGRGAGRPSPGPVDNKGVFVWIWPTFTCPQTSSEKEY